MGVKVSSNTGEPKKQSSHPNQYLGDRPSLFFFFCKHEGNVSNLNLISAELPTLLIASVSSFAVIAGGELNPAAVGCIQKQRLLKDNLITKTAG